MGSEQENERPQRPAPRDTLDGLNLPKIVRGLSQDLADLRAGKISVVEARARAQLAHEILRGIGQVIQAQRFIAQAAKFLPNPDAKPGKKKPGKGRASEAETIEG